MIKAHKIFETPFTFVSMIDDFCGFYEIEVQGVSLDPLLMSISKRGINRHKKGLIQSNRPKYSELDNLSWVLVKAEFF